MPLPQEVLDFLVLYRYAIIFPLAIAEGPLTTVLGGVLVSLGCLDFAPVLAIVIAGDIIADIVYYFLGRSGRDIIHKIKFIKIPEERIKHLEDHYINHPWKTMIVGKLSYGLGAIFLVASGAARMPFRKFMELIASLTIIKSSLLLLAGYYFGKASIYLTGYLRYYSLAIVSVLIIGYIVFKKMKAWKKISPLEKAMLEKTTDSEKNPAS